MSAVRTIRVEASAPYDVRFERGSLLQVGEAVQALGVREAVVVTDDTAVSYTHLTLPTILLV